MSVVQEAYERTLDELKTQKETQEELKFDVDKLVVKTNELQHKLELLTKKKTNLAALDRKSDLLGESVKNIHNLEKMFSKGKGYSTKNTRKQYEDLKAGNRKKSKTCI